LQKVFLGGYFLTHTVHRIWQRF